jgi:hypothetical protein
VNSPQRARRRSLRYRKDSRSSVWVDKLISTGWDTSHEDREVLPYAHVYEDQYMIKGGRSCDRRETSGRSRAVRRPVPESRRPPYQGPRPGARASPSWSLWMCILGWPCRSFGIARSLRRWRSEVRPRQPRREARSSAWAGSSMASVAVLPLTPRCELLAARSFVVVGQVSGRWRSLGAVRSR